MELKAKVCNPSPKAIDELKYNIKIVKEVNINEEL